MIHLLKGVIMEGTGHAASELGRPACGKTGTSQDQRDLWFIGFTPDLVCGAWMGYDDFSPLGKKLTAGSILVPWWTEFMKIALKDTPINDFNVPSGINFVKIDKRTGYLALPTCPVVILEAFKEGTEPKEFCPVDHLQTPIIEMETEE
jgi:penicillin-binding protein 1A